MEKLIALLCCAVVRIYFLIDPKALGIISVT
jgi:hypothetical protein